MPIYAVIEKGVVLNRIEADSLLVIGMLLPDAELVIEETDATGASHIGSEYRKNKNKFVPVQTYPSWTWDEKKFEWVAPVTYPTDGKTYFWDEEATTWVDVTTVEAIAPDGTK